MYQRIEDLPSNASALGSQELVALSRVWNERRGEMQEDGAYREFLKRLQREWAIETGIIERLYTWDRGVTQVLIEHGIEASVIAHRGGVSQSEASHIKNLIDDQLEIVEGLFSFVKGDQPLTEHFIRGIHAKFTTHQDTTEALTPDGRLVQIPLTKGEYKRQPNNPIRPDGSLHEYCPPELVPDEMQALLRMYGSAEAQSQPVEVLAAWFHHRFAQIHPFQDGNGRVARALATLIFLRSGAFPLVVRDADRAEYILALEKADAGDLGSLVNIFSKRQREAILLALGLEQQVHQAKHAEQIISAAVQMLKDKFAAESVRRGEVVGTAERLWKLSRERLSQVRNALQSEFRALRKITNQNYWATSSSVGSEGREDRRGYFYNQIIEVANHFKYFANVAKYRSWVRLTIKTEIQFEYVISFHGYGHGDSGIMACSAFTAIRAPREGNDGSEAIGTHEACTDLFQFNYAETAEDSEARFRDWLEASIAIALAQWKRQISS